MDRRHLLRYQSGKVAGQRRASGRKSESLRHQRKIDNHKCIYLSGHRYSDTAHSTEYANNWLVPPSCSIKICIWFPYLTLHWMMIFRVGFNGTYEGSERGIATIASWGKTKTKSDMPINRKHVGSASQQKTTDLVQKKIRSTRHKLSAGNQRQGMWTIDNKSSQKFSKNCKFYLSNKNINKLVIFWLFLLFYYNFCCIQMRSNVSNSTHGFNNDLYAYVVIYIYNISM